MNSLSDLIYITTFHVYSLLCHYVIADCLLKAVGKLIEPLKQLSDLIAYQLAFKEPQFHIIIPFISGTVLSDEIYFVLLLGLDKNAVSVLVFTNDLPACIYNICVRNDLTLLGS